MITGSVECDRRSDSELLGVRCGRWAWHMSGVELVEGVSRPCHGAFGESGLQSDAGRVVGSIGARGFHAVC